MKVKILHVSGVIQKGWLLTLMWFLSLGIVVTATLASAAPLVPAGFAIHVVASGYPQSDTGTLQDIAPGPGGLFGSDLYFLVYPNEIWRVSPLGGVPSLFTNITDANDGRVMRFGFNDNLFVTEGGVDHPGRVYEILPDGTYRLFANTPTASEGIAHSAGGAFGNRLFVSEFDSYPNPITSIDSNGNDVIFTTLDSSRRLTGLAFGTGDAFGSNLFATDHNGTIFNIAPDGSYTTFAINLPIGRNETLAFGSASTLFGDNLFVTPDRTTSIFKITSTGMVSEFASNFEGFRYEGVSGLKFSEDKKMLFITDDAAGTIYAINAINVVPEPSTWLLFVIALTALLIVCNRGHKETGGNKPKKFFN